MTYKDSYEKCKTVEDLKKEVIKDVEVALFIGSLDRVKVIEIAASEVMQSRGWALDSIFVETRKESILIQKEV